MNAWKNPENILCIRPDNMGDLLMSAPAMAALKETFNCKITVLTSPFAKHIAAYIPSVDDIIVWETPWVKGAETLCLEKFDDIVRTLRERAFDAAVIFSVFSQNPLPSALMAALAGIPNRLAYCRENPYQLLSHWVEEKEPYTLLRHQVRRDLDLVMSVGAHTKDDRITLTLPMNFESEVENKMRHAGMDPAKPWLIMHPGVSEQKRKYDSDLWIETGMRITTELGYQIIVTGVESEGPPARRICDGIGSGSFSLAGKLSLEELITLIRFSPLLISVNTGTVHLAAALETRVIVLYALTNPQHPPWKGIGRVLPFSISEKLKSRNEVLRFIQRKYYSQKKFLVTPDDILDAARELLINKEEPMMEELVLPSHPHLQGRRNTLNFHEP